MGDAPPYIQVALEDLVEWQTTVVSTGAIVEVDLGFSSMNTGREIWAAFYVLDNIITDDGSLELSVRCLGAEEEDSKKSLYKLMNGKAPGTIHMCVSRPCYRATPEPDTALHVTLIRIWTEDDFRSAHHEYVAEHMLRQIPKWKGASEPKLGIKPTPKVAGVRAKRTPPKVGPKRKSPKSATTKPARDDKPGAGNAVSPEMRKKLRQRLDAIKEKTLGGGTAGVEDLAPDAEEEEEDGLEDDPIEPVRAKSRLSGGTSIKPHSGVLKTSGFGKGPPKKKTTPVLALEDQNVTSIRSSRGQLVSQVLQASKLSQSGKKKKKKKGSQSGTTKLAHALKSILDGKDKKTDHKKKKKKGRKRVLDASGVIVSCSDSSL